MNLREQFQKLHPVPDCAYWCEQVYLYGLKVPAEVGTDTWIECYGYNSLWQGFQSGHAAGLEDITADLDFEPDENHTIADMANVGRSLMADIKIYRPDYCWNERPSEIVGDLSERITELEASLADSNEALQVMGLKLTGRVFDAIDADHEANTVGGPTPVMDAAPACEQPS